MRKVNHSERLIQPALRAIASQHMRIRKAELTQEAPKAALFPDRQEASVTSTNRTVILFFFCEHYIRSKIHNHRTRK